jgi:hypothetical protein
MSNGPVPHAIHCLFVIALSLPPVLPAAAAPKPALRVVEMPDTVAVFAGDRQLLEYRVGPALLKPFASKLFSPSGVQVLRDSPSDHKHHHALMFALSIGKVNFWEETEGTGKQQPRSLQVLKERKTKTAAQAGFTQTLDWLMPGDGMPVARERRTLEVSGTADIGATLLTWRSGMSAPAERGPVALGGAHYFGLGMRFAESMDRGGRFFNAEGLDGEVVRGSEKLTPARWAAYTAQVDGKTVTVAIFDHPGNVRHPSRIFTMTTPFAYLSATLNLWKEPITLEPARPLDLVYGVAVWDGAVQPAQVESLYRRWAGR